MSRLRYQLIDFGGGRKLESVGGHTIDRPSPAAEGFQRNSPKAWGAVDSRFDAKRKSWDHRLAWPNSLVLECGDFRMPVRPTPYGHIGLFPEQASNWRWLADTEVAKKEAKDKVDAQSVNALNLFAYTGASTMALVAAGFRVAHVDAAKPNVQAARSACDTNGWPEAPVRYLVDDAAKFAARERRRERIYHTIVMDPPAYGHSPSGKAWRLERDLWPLLTDCLHLIQPSGFRLLITGHSPEVTAGDVTHFLVDALQTKRGVKRSDLKIESGRNELADQSNRKLDAGFYVRVQGSSDA